MENSTASIRLTSEFPTHLFTSTVATLLSALNASPVTVAGGDPLLVAAGENPNVAPQSSIADTIEILIYTICLCVGGPLNLISFRKLSRNFIGGAKNAAFAKQNAAHITLLKLNLNIADLLTMFVYTLSQIIWMINYQWYAGDLLCRICKFFHTFGFYLNSFVVACFALDRAFSTYNLKTLNSAQAALRRVKRMLILAWTFAFLLSLPQSFIFRVVEPPEMKDFRQCTPIWTILGYEIDLEIGRLMKANLLTEARKNELMQRFTKVVIWERTYNIAHLLFVFWIPTLIIIGSYVTMLCVLSSFSVSRSFKTKMSLRQTMKTSRKSNLLTKTAIFGIGKFEKPSKTVSELNRNADGALLTADSYQNLDKNAATPRNSVTFAMATTQNGVPGSDCSRTAERHFSSDSSTTALQSLSLFSNHNKKSNNDGKWVAISMSPPPSIRYDEDQQVGGSRSGFIMADKSSSDICPVQSPLLAAVKNTGGNNCIGTMALRRIAKARQKTKRQAALILMAYLTIWTPYNLLAMLNAFSSNDGVVKKVASVTLPFLNSMIVMNPIVNPIIYGLYESRRNSI